MHGPSERERLAALYSKMSEGELERVASESDELTDTARQVLQLEIERRGLETAVHHRALAGDERIELQPWSLVRRYRDLHEAMLAKGMLDSAGIECRLADENIVRLDWFISNLVGGVRLMVKPEDAEAANEILSQPIPPDIDYGVEGQFEQPTCPRCASMDITFEELNKPLSYMSAWLGIPLPIASPKWKCESCGAKWVENEDPPLEEEPQP